MKYLLIALLLACTIPSSGDAAIYKWIDDRGQAGFSDDLGKVPAKYRDKAVTAEKEDQAVEVIEKPVAEKPSRNDGEKKPDKEKEKDKDPEKPSFGGKTGEAWKQDFARQNNEVKTIEEQIAGLKDRMADSSKVSRGEYITLQHTVRDAEIRLERARKKLTSLSEAADRAEVPAEFR